MPSVPCLRLAGPTTRLIVCSTAAHDTHLPWGPAPHMPVRLFGTRTPKLPLSDQAMPGIHPGPGIRSPVGPPLSVRPVIPLIDSPQLGEPRPRRSTALSCHTGMPLCTSSPQRLRDWHHQAVCWRARYTVRYARVTVFADALGFFPDGDRFRRHTRVFFLAPQAAGC